MYGRCADPEVGWLPTSAPGRHQGGHRAGGMARPRRHRRGGLSVKKTHDYIHHYRGYWSDGCKCRIQIYQEDERAPGVAVRVDAEVHVKLDLLGVEGLRAIHVRSGNRNRFELPTHAVSPFLW